MGMEQFETVAVQEIKITYTVRGVVKTWRYDLDGKHFGDIVNVAVAGGDDIFKVFDAAGCLLVTHETRGDADKHIRGLM